MILFTFLFLFFHFLIWKHILMYSTVSISRNYRVFSFFFFFSYWTCNIIIYNWINSLIYECTPNIVNTKKKNKINILFFNFFSFKSIDIDRYITKLSIDKSNWNKFQINSKLPNLSFKNFRSRGVIITTDAHYHRYTKRWEWTCCTWGSKKSNHQSVWLTMCLFRRIIKWVFWLNFYILIATSGIHFNWSISIYCE